MIAAEQKALGISHAAAQFLFGLWPDEGRASESTSIRDSEIRELAWKLLSQIPRDVARKVEYDWVEVLLRLGKFAPRRAVQLLFSAGLAKGYLSRSDHALNGIVSMAALYPKDVMACFGDAIIDKEWGMRLSIGEGAETIIKALPPSDVLDWVRGAGDSAARVLARELPLPFVDESGEAIVPSVTLAFLEEFGADDETCEAFVRGAVRGDSWWGNGGDYFRAKAASAKRFLSHENRCVRRWAQMEVGHSESLAKEQQTQFEEGMI